jgi:hypothetical protein
VGTRTAIIEVEEAFAAERKRAGHQTLARDPVGGNLGEVAYWGRKRWIA